MQPLMDQIMNLLHWKNMKRHTPGKGQQTRAGSCATSSLAWLQSRWSEQPEGNKRTLIEVKCPMLGKESSIVNCVPKRKEQLLHAAGENTVLKKKHKYYSHEQLDMLLLATEVCHFVVYSPVESPVVKCQGTCTCGIFWVGCNTGTPRKFFLSRKELAVANIASVTRT